MGIPLNTYFLYQLHKDKALLIRAIRPAYSNASQVQENEAEKILDAKVKLLLEKYLEDKSNLIPQFIGEFQGLPEGDLLYEKQGTLGLEYLRYTSTKHTGNYIFISIAKDEATFLKIISEEDFADNGYTQSDLNLPSQVIRLTDFITENDFDLSSIPDAYTLDLAERK